MRIVRVVVLFAAVAASVPAQSIFEGTFEVTERGCVASRNAIFEVFAPGNFDLDGAAIAFVPNGLGAYDCVASTATPLPFGAQSATSIDTMAGDDTVTGPHALTFTFAYPGGAGATTAIDISSNGAVYLEAGTNIDTRCCSADVIDFLSATPSFSPLQEDFDASPLGHGTIWFDEQQLAGGEKVAVITWDDVAEWSVPSSSINMQCQLHESGRCDFIYFGVSPVRADALVGWSAGGGQPDYGHDELSNLPVFGGDGSISLPLTIDSADVPLVGSSMLLDFTNVPASTVAGALLVGDRRSRFPLDIIGLEGCHLLVENAFATLNLPLPISSVPLPTLLPDTEGLKFEVQGLLLAPGSTTLGAILSNRGTLVVGNDLTQVVSTDPGLVVQFEGFNSFGCAMQSMPFFNVFNNSLTGEMIESVTIDLAGSSDPRLHVAIFDVDGNCLTGGVGDFMAGDSALQSGLCPSPNSYRGTDVACGLRYAGSTVSLCDPSATTGWTGSNLITGDPATLTFDFDAFGPGCVFGFDADIDGGPLGANGLHRALVTIVTDQRTVSSELVVVDLNTAIQVF